MLLKLMAFVFAALLLAQSSNISEPTVAEQFAEMITEALSTSEISSLLSPTTLAILHSLQAKEPECSRIFLITL